MKQLLLRAGSLDSGEMPGIRRVSALRGFGGSRRFLCGAPLIFVEVDDTVQISADEARSVGVIFPEEIKQSAPARQTEFVLGRLAAQVALRNIFPGSSGSPIVGLGWNGVPVWPDGAVGSISHTQGFACAIAVAKHECRYVGVDVERVANGSNQRALRSYVVNSLEISLLQKSLSISDDADLDRIVTQVFGVKEAFFKATYPVVGHYFGFDVVRVHAVRDVSWREHGIAQIVLELQRNLGNCLLQGSLWEVDVCIVPDSDVLLALMAC